MQWAIFTLAYGHHPEVYYGVEPASGDPVEIGPYRVQPFELVKLRPMTKDEGRTITGWGR